MLPVIYRCQAHLQRGDLAGARSDLDLLRRSEIPEKQRLEFLRSAALYAMEARDFSLARELALDLKSLDLDALYFRSQRDALRGSVLEFIAEENSPGTMEEKRGRFQAMIRRLQGFAEYFELKPNIMGVGINFNRIFGRRSKGQ